MQTMSLLPQQRRWSHSAAVDPDDYVGLLSKVLDEIDTAILVCDERATIRMLNGSAQRELGAGRLLSTGGETLRATAVDAGLGAAIRAACRSGRRAVLALAAGDGRVPVSVSPLSAPDGEGLALVMLGRREPCSRSALELLGIQQGLTPAERKVLAGLAAARTPAQIAGDHCVALSTVRTQIAALRAKLGARSQQALVCLVYAVPPLANALRLTETASTTQRNGPLEWLQPAA